MAKAATPAVMSHQEDSPVPIPMREKPTMAPVVVSTERDMLYLFWFRRKAYPFGTGG
jgi:hypothetical protein